MKDTATQAPADAAAVATAHRPETETPPVHAPGCVTLTARDAENAAGWLRRFLADNAALDADGDSFDAEPLAEIVRLVGILEKSPAFRE